jgi:hypothetical protein
MSLSIPRGEEMISVELTVKEAMALGAGVKFSLNHKLIVDAKRKLRHQLDDKLMTAHNEKIDYHLLEL